MLKKIIDAFRDYFRIQRSTPWALPKPDEPMPFDADRIAELLESNDVEHFEEIARRIKN